MNDAASTTLSALMEKAGSAWIRQAAEPLEKSADLGGSIRDAAGKAWNSASSGYTGATLGGAGIGALLGSIGSLAEEDWSVRKALRAAMLGGLAGGAVGAGGKLGVDSLGAYQKNREHQRQLDAAAEAADPSVTAGARRLINNVILPYARGSEGDFRPGASALAGGALGAGLDNTPKKNRNRVGTGILHGIYGAGAGVAGNLAPEGYRNTVNFATYGALSGAEPFLRGQKFDEMLNLQKKRSGNWWQDFKDRSKTRGARGFVRAALLGAPALFSDFNR